MDIQSSRIARAVGVLLGFAGLVWVGARLANDWSEVRQVLADLDAADIAWSMILLFAGECVAASIWTWNLWAAGAEMTVRDGTVTYFGSNLARFLPGAILAYVSRVSLVTGFGIRAVTATYILTVQTLLSMAGALIVGAVALTGGLVADRRLGIGVVGVITTVLVIGAVTSDQLLARFVPAASGQRAMPAGRQFWTLAAFIPKWVLTGLSLSVLVPTVPTLHAVGAMSLAWFIGFVAAPVPAGIGVREAALVVSLGPILGGASAAVAVVHRVLWSLMIAGTGAAALPWIRTGPGEKPSERIS